MAGVALAVLFRAIDARDVGRFLGFLAPDAAFRFGNAPTVTGRAAIGPQSEHSFTASPD